MTFIFFFSCDQERMMNPIPDGMGENSRMKMIREEGKIVAVTDYNSTNYFVYKGEPMGYQFDLLQSLADYLGVKLEVIVSNNLEETFKYLQEGDCDLIAVNLTITKERSKFLDFTIPHSQTRQVLVQRKPDKWQRMSKDEMEGNLLRNQLDLGGKTVYVQKKSTFADRLNSLSDEIGDSIHVVELPNYETEQLIRLVSEGEIDYTVCDEIVGKVNQTYFPNIDIETAISFPQNLAWAVRKGDKDLLESVNAWLEDFKKTARYANTYKKYFKNARSANIVKSDYYSVMGGKVSEFDDIFKEQSKVIDWDWRLLASLVYQESNFDPGVKSWAGAFGLMQLMPTTASRYGVDSLSSPLQNINAGVQYIQWLDGILIDKISDPAERQKFVIASYNVGLGHILDARRLASKNGKNPDVWTDNVDYFILNKSDPQYYRDPVVKYGYCRGVETFNYVAEIYDRFNHYKNVIVEN
ncbi:MAG: transporter substrate-binding domain-containing protein [Bacteroidales bacterium]|nr:transporter substrate-binding domain-containing protein [Bacteroidales bacterium]MCF8454833.1 transporter substrate-binding domain-containing protein [Bacteroidales bacterium]